MIILGIVWLQSGTLLATQSSALQIIFQPQAVAFLAISLLISAITWLTIKPLMLKADKASAKEISVSKWMRNPDVFLSLLYKQRKVDITPWKDDIILGNPTAPLQIMIACNPYCDPCAEGHKLVEELLAAHPKSIGVTVRFLVRAADKNDKRTIAVKYILTASSASLNPMMQKEVKHPIDVWFEWMDLEKYINIYPILDTSNANDRLLEHESWAKDSKIFFTPTNFVNGFQLPGQYSLRDLKLMVTQINENITPIASVYNEAD